MPKIHYTRFTITSPLIGKLPTCWRAELLAHQQVCNKLATSRCNGIWETTRQNRHNGLLPAPTCYGLVVYVVDLLQTCYGETGVLDFGLKWILICSFTATLMLKCLWYIINCLYVCSGSHIENWHSIMRQGLLNATNTKLQVNGAAHGAGVYLSPIAKMSFGYSNMRRPPTQPVQRSDTVI